MQLVFKFYQVLRVSIDDVGRISHVYCVKRIILLVEHVKDRSLKSFQI